MYYLKDQYSLPSQPEVCIAVGRLLFAESEQISKVEFSYLETRQSLSYICNSSSAVVSEILWAVLVNLSRWQVYGVQV